MARVYFPASRSQRIVAILARIGWVTVFLLIASGEPWYTVGAAPDDIRVIHDIAYRTGASRQWKLDLAMKAETPATPRPGIVVIHGGGWLEGDKTSFASREHGVPGNIVDFAALGFVAVTVNYRLSGEAPFPAALEDCKCAVRWLRAHAKDYRLDPARIGAFGNSAGGHLALLLGMMGKDAGLEGDGPYQDQSSAVQSVVSDSGPIDLFDQYRTGTLREVCSRFLGGSPEGKRATAYRKASPMYQLAGSLPPFLLIYGVDDGQVPVETADRFVLALGRRRARRRQLPSTWPRRSLPLFARSSPDVAAGRQ